MGESVDAVLLSDMDAYWRAANYLSLGQMYLLSNPLLREPLRPEHLKPRTTVDWGETSVEKFIYVHLNRVIKQHDRNMCYLASTDPTRRRSSRMPISRGRAARLIPTALRTRRACGGCSGNCERLRDFLHGNGHHPHFVEGEDLAKMHALIARSLDQIIDRAKAEAVAGATAEPP